MAATQINKVTFERSLIPYEDLWAKAVRGPFNWRIYLFHIYRRMWVLGKIDGTGKFNWWADIILYIMLHNREARWWRLKDVYIFLPDSDKMSATKIENDQLVWMTTHTHTSKPSEVVHVLVNKALRCLGKMSAIRKRVGTVIVPLRNQK